MNMIVTLDKKYERYEGSKYWYSNEKNIPDGTIRLIDGKLYYSIIGSTEKIKWIPIIKEHLNKKWQMF